MNHQAVIPAERELLHWNTVEADLSRKLHGQKEMMVYNADERARVEAGFRTMAQVGILA